MGIAKGYKDGVYYFMKVNYPEDIERFSGFVDWYELIKHVQKV